MKKKKNNKALGDDSEVEEENQDAEDEEFCQYTVSAKRPVWSELFKDKTESEKGVPVVVKEEKPRVCQQILDIYKKGPSGVNKDYEKFAKMLEEHKNDPRFSLMKNEQDIYDMGPEIVNPYYEYAKIVIDHAKDTYGDPKTPAAKIFQLTELHSKVRVKSKSGKDEVKYITEIKPFEQLVKRGDMVGLNVSISMFFRKGSIIGVTFYYNSISLEYSADPILNGGKNKNAETTQFDAFLLSVDVSKKGKKEKKLLLGGGGGGGGGEGEAKEGVDDDDDDEEEKDKQNFESIKSITNFTSNFIFPTDNHNNNNNNNNNDNNKSEKEREIEIEREVEREIEIEKEKEKEKEKEVNKDKEREKDSSKEKRKEREREREKDKDKDKDNDNNLKRNYHQDAMDDLKKFKNNKTEDN